jgi:hypothetical protein
MKARKRGTFEPATLGNIRSHGCRNLLMYCGSIHCNYQTKMNADHLPDETPQAAGRPHGLHAVRSPRRRPGA